MILAMLDYASTCNKLKLMDMVILMECLSSVSA
jgi:hypothetical protein